MHILSHEAKSVLKLFC